MQINLPQIIESPEAERIRFHRFIFIFLIMSTFDKKEVLIKYRIESEREKIVNRYGSIDCQILEGPKDPPDLFFLNG